MFTTQSGWKWPYFVNAAQNSKCDIISLVFEFWKKKPHFVNFSESSYSCDALTRD